MTIYTHIHMTLYDLLLLVIEVCCWVKMLFDGKSARGRTRILTDSARKETGKTFWQIILKQELT